MSRPLLCQRGGCTAPAVFMVNGNGNLTTERHLSCANHLSVTCRELLADDPKHAVVMVTPASRWAGGRQGLRRSTRL